MGKVALVVVVFFAIDFRKASGKSSSQERSSWSSMASSPELVSSGHHSAPVADSTGKRRGRLRQNEGTATQGSGRSVPRSNSDRSRKGQSSGASHTRLMLRPADQRANGMLQALASPRNAGPANPVDVGVERTERRGHETAMAPAEERVHEHRDKIGTGIVGVAQLLRKANEYGLVPNLSCISICLAIG